MRLMKNMCPRYQAAMEILGKRWTGLIVNVLLEGPKRFSALASRLDLVSERMLSERLKELESHGIVERQVLPDTPVRVQYELTEKGRALSGVVAAIESWASRWVDPAAESLECAEDADLERFGSEALQAPRLSRS
jgi:DNA-binding HxlR family transcriptional regulator